jgi:macrolide-specific efflux system membrane fusion protein
MFISRPGADRLDSIMRRHIFEESMKEPSMNRQKFRTVSLALVVLLAAGLHWACSDQEPPAGTPDVSGRTDSAETEAGEWVSATVERRDIDLHVRAPGIIKPSVGSEVRVGSRVSGIVSKLHVKIGDQVSKGQLLAELDPTELVAYLNQAEATLNNARARLDYARLDAERKRTLFRDSLVSQNELDRAERSLEVAASEVKQAEANLDFARIQVRYTKISAPIPGVVASISTLEGETVAASFQAPTFVTIIDLDRLELQAYVDETDIGNVTVGQKARFDVDTYPEADFAGEVTTIYPKAEIREGRVKYVTVLKITPIEGKPLRPEMSTSVAISTGESRNALVVPHGALHRGDDGYYVRVLQDGSPVKRVVKVGLGDATHTAVLEGLVEGDKVIIGDV